MLLRPLLVSLWAVASCSVTCPDRRQCSNQETCCLSDTGYKCCPYPNAVCCSDRAHCCPFGFTCDLTAQMCVRRWENKLMLNQDGPLKVKQTALQEGQAPPPEDQAPPPEDQAPPSADQAPPSADQAPPSADQAPPSVVYCDNYFYCSDGYTCCRHPGGGWTCCPYSPARCCLDGYHCCPYGYDCDYTYTHCIRRGVPYPFSKLRPPSVPADPVHVPRPFSSSRALAPPTDMTLAAQGEEPAAQGEELQEAKVIRCDSQFFCKEGQTCCPNKDKTWSCCPFALGSCCADGEHCCKYSQTCDPSSEVCRKWSL